MVVSARAKYEVRPHQVNGLVTLTWLNPGEIPTNVLTLGEDRLPLVARALAEYMATHPRLASPKPEGDKPHE
jgi:hypothetical protein